MQTSVSLRCPFCGQYSDLEIDCTLPSQQFVTDCEVCCRPMEVSVHCDRGEVVDVSTSAE